MAKKPAQRHSRHRSDLLGAAGRIEMLERRVMLALVPAGPEFRVNTFTTLAQADAVIASDADGDFVVTWRSRDQDGSLYGIYAQRYSSSGVAQGAEFRVNTTTAGNQTSPAIAMDGDGDFVIAWESAGQDSGTYGVYLQRYNSSGVAQGGEVRANTFTANNQIRPALAMDDIGNFVVAWKSAQQDGDGYGIYAQRYSSAGVAQGVEFRANSHTTNSQDAPAVAMDASGDFVIVWQSNYQDGDAGGIYAQRYNSGGLAQGGEFRVNADTVFDQVDPSVAMSANGDFVVAWRDRDEAASPGVYAQRFDAAGAAQGPEFRVNTFTTGTQERPAVAMDDSGNFVLVWHSGLQDGSAYGVYAQRFNAAGFTQGSEFRVNTTTTLGQGGPSTAMDADGDFIITWQSDGQDGSGNGIYSQRFDQFEPTAATPLGPEFRVNTTTTGFQGRSHIAADDVGNFVVTWASPGQGGDTVAVYAQRYNAAGVPQGSEFKVNTTVAATTNWTVRPRVAMDNDGDFVIVWSVTDSNYPTAFGVRAQRYNATGVPQGGELIVSDGSRFDGQSSVAMDADGDFVVTWEGSLFPDYRIFARRYNAAGVPQSLEFAVGDAMPSGNLPRIAISDQGAFAVVWTSGPTTVTGRCYTSTGGPFGPAFPIATLAASGEVAADAEGNYFVTYATATGEIAARLLYPSGAARGTVFQLNQYTTDSQSLPRISSNAQGEFLVSWNSVGQDGDLSGVYARRFDRYGVAMEDEFRVNSYTTSDQLTSQAVLLNDGDFVVQWSSNLQDGSSFGVYGQRFTDELVAPAVNTSSFLFNSSPHRLTFTFSQDVSASLGTDDILLENLTTSTTIPSTDLSLSYDTGTNTATFSYTGNASGIGGVLPDGDYRATLIAAGITNAQGVPLPANHVFNFFFLNGDANRDGRVNLNDFNILAANFGQSPRSFEQGDFNYDTIVNLSDFNILASRFGQVLAAPDMSSTLFGDRSIVRDDWLVEMLS